MKSKPDISEPGQVPVLSGVLGHLRDILIVSPFGDSGKISPTGATLTAPVPSGTGPAWVSRVAGHDAKVPGALKGNGKKTGQVEWTPGLRQPGKLHFAVRC